MKQGGDDESGIIYNIGRGLLFQRILVGCLKDGMKVISHDDHVECFYHNGIGLVNIYWFSCTFGVLNVMALWFQCCTTGFFPTNNLPSKLARELES